MRPPRVLFVCTYSGARSRIAEAFAKQLAPGRIDAHSSGFEREPVGPLPIAVMREIGIELPAVPAKLVFDRYRDKEVFDHVVTLCHEATAEQCAVFRSNVSVLYGRDAEMLSWSIRDFKSLSGTDEERLNDARKIRDHIREEVVALLTRLGIGMGAA